MKKVLIVFICVVFSLEATAQKAHLIKLEDQQQNPIPVHVSDKLLDAEMEHILAHPEHYQPKPSLPKQAVDNVGDERAFYIPNLETNIASQHSFRLIKKGEYSQVWLEISELDNGHLTTAVADTIFKYLESQSTPFSFNPEMGIVELINTYMGDPPNIDGDGLVDFLITDVKDGYDPNDEGGYTAGFFRPHDQNTDAMSNTSNKRDVLYIDSFPGIYYDGKIDAKKPLFVLAHEYQHLIHFNYNGSLGANEINFVNEGQSNFASLLTGYFPHNNYPSYLSNTNVPLFRWSDGADLLADYGRAASFTAYLWDQLGYENSGLLTQDPLSGLSGIKNALFEANSPYSFEEMLVNWGIANLINDQELTGETAYGYAQELIADQIVKVGFENPDFSNRNTAVQAGAIKYFGFQQVKNLRITVNHEGQASGQARLITDDGESIEVYELNEGTEFSTPNDVLYESVYLMLVYTDPNADEDSPLIFTTNLSAEQNYEFSTLRTFGGNQNSEIYVFDLTGPSYNGLSNRFTSNKNALLHSIELFLFEGIIGDSDLKYSLHINNTDGTPGTELAADTINFSELGSGWQIFDVSHWNKELTQNEQFHIVYQVLDQAEGDEILVRLDNGKGTPGVTHVRFNDGNFEQLSLQTLGEGYGFWNQIVLAEEVVVSNEHIADIPPGFELQQNYPNPFNPSTVISFQLSANSNVKLEVFDLTGRKVATLVNEHMPAGNHHVTFNASNLASGMYFYTIKAGDFVDTHKMILMK